MSSMVGSTVLLDNTTIHGAIAAYEGWPPRLASWTSDPYAVNLRSLMDVIEAIVLFDVVVLDGACGSLAEPAADEGDYDPSRGWQPFQGLRDLDSGESIFFVNYFSTREDVIGAGILATAAQRFQQNLREGRIQRQAGLFSTNRLELAVPRFYANPAEFMSMLRRSFSATAISSVQDEISQLEQALSSQPSEVANFAMFAFRGFYYSELAHLLSMSYMPQSFRASVLAGDGSGSRERFIRLALGSVQGLRREYVETLGAQLSSQLNAELTGPTLGADLPLIASYVASHATRRSELMPATLEIRNSRSARQFRRWASKVQSAIDEQARLQVIRDARRELDDLCSDLRAELRLAHFPSTQVTMKLAVPTGVLGLDVPIKLSARQPLWLHNMIHRRPHLRFLRDLALSGIEFAPFELRYRTLPALYASGDIAYMRVVPR